MNINYTIAAGLNFMYANGLQGGQVTRNIILNSSDKKAMANYLKAQEENSGMSWYASELNAVIGV